uniref:Uncharacterized protein n=1 Tax=Dulem virus 42 TaxID=3145760 RepID=A0AAU8BAK7_9CAUD
MKLKYKSYQNQKGKNKRTPATCKGSRGFLLKRHGI